MMFKTVLFVALLGVTLGQFTPFRQWNRGRFPYDYDNRFDVINRNRVNFINRNRFNDPDYFRRYRGFNPTFRTLGAAPYAAIIRSESEGPYPDGSYYFNFESEDGIRRAEEGVPKDPITHQKTGTYEYTSPEGKDIAVSYVADELGYRAESSHLPGGTRLASARSLADFRKAREEYAKKG